MWCSLFPGASALFHQDSSKVSQSSLVSSPLLIQGTRKTCGLLGFFFLLCIWSPVIPVVLSVSPGSAAVSRASPEPAVTATAARAQTSSSGRSATSVAAPLHRGNCRGLDNHLLSSSSVCYVSFVYMVEKSFWSKVSAARLC